MNRRALLATLAILVPSTSAPPSAGAQEVKITEWQVPWEASRPRDPFVGPDGRVWFVGQQSDYVAVLSPESGEFRRYDLADGAGPHNLIVSPQGAVYYAGNRAVHIGRLDPETGRVVTYDMPDPAARDPHTLVFDSHGDIWFTVQNGNFVGKFEVADGATRLVPVPTPNSRPYGIVVDRADRPWFTEFAGGKIGTVNPRTLELTELALPRAEARPRRLAVTSDGTVWYVDFAGGMLGAIDPGSGAVREWAVPGGSAARPYGMATDDEDRIWFVETGSDPNRLVGFDPASEEFLGITDIPSGGGSVRHMYFHAPTGDLWFGTDANTVGRAALPRRGPPAAGPPQGARTEEDRHG